MPAPGTGPRRYRGDIVMKKQRKKLMLAKETLTRLENSLGRIVGGLTAIPECATHSCAPPYSECNYSGIMTCMTCESECTTNYC
jgi:hypothetical protein